MYESYDFRKFGWYATDDIPEPCPRKNEILLKALSCGLNFADTLLIQGKYQQKPDLPFSRA